MPVIDRLSVDDFDEAISFLNRVFSIRSPHDSERLLPALYQRDERSMRCNYAIRHNGNLAAMAGVFHVDWQVGDELIRIGGVGGVAIDRTMGSPDLMDELLSRILRDLRQSDCDIVLLNGQRHRYGAFGFERAGTELVYDVNPRDLPADDTFDARATSLVPMSDESLVLGMAREWHERQFSFCRREPHRFYAFLNNWHNMAWLAGNSMGQFVGYVVGADGGGPTPEVVGRDDAAAVQIATARIRSAKRPVMFTTSAMPSPVTRLLTEVAEAVTARTSGLWQVLDWRRVTNALLKARCAAEPLPPGRVTVNIAGCDATIALNVDGREASCESTSDRPMLVASASSALRLLFGPNSPAQVVDLPHEAAVLQAWCPLPLAIPRLDHV